MVYDYPVLPVVEFIRTAHGLMAFAPDGIPVVKQYAVTLDLGVFELAEAAISQENDRRIKQAVLLTQQAALAEGYRVSVNGPADIDAFRTAHPDFPSIEELACPVQDSFFGMTIGALTGLQLQAMLFACLRHAGEPVAFGQVARMMLPYQATAMSNLFVQAMLAAIPLPALLGDEKNAETGGDAAPAAHGTGSTPNDSPTASLG